MLIKLLWARVAPVLLVFEHDLTMDVPLENGFSDIRHCYHSNIYQERFTCTRHYEELQVLYEICNSS